jgi:hypothetical protein
LKIKQKGRHVDAIEAIEEESQAMLNTLIEHDFQDAFKKMAKGRNGVRGLLRGWWWPVGPKLVFNQITAPVPKIMSGRLYIPPKCQLTSNGLHDVISQKTIFL